MSTLAHFVCLFLYLFFVFFCFFAYKSSSCSVGEQEDIEGLALETDCLPRYVAKGIALGCFVFARCLHHGWGVEQNREQAKRWYSRAGTFDLDVVARLQDEMTYGYI